MTEKEKCPFKSSHKDQPEWCMGRHISSEELIKMEWDYAAHNYEPIQCVFDRAEGVFVWDPEGRKYYDFLSAYSAVNQGHCHPKIVEALTEQAKRLTLSSRAFYNSVFPRFAKMCTEMFGYDMVLPMNSGAEGVETALKLAKKWGYKKKGIPNEQAMVISAHGCFHGRTIAVISMSDDKSQTEGFGPFVPGIINVEYNNIDSLREALEKYGKNVCAFIVEPIQGEAGVVVPDDGYLAKCHALCKEHNVLLITDEIQTGLARTGKLLCSEWDGVKGDILILGKAISGGLLPLSCVLADKEIMLCIQPGEHGSTYGGSPLSSAVGIAALQVIIDENLVERSRVLGERLREGLRKINCPAITCVRGRGLLSAVVVDPNWEKSASDACNLMKERGLLAKYTHKHIIRFAPPLTITDEQLDECIKIIKGVFEDLVTMKKEDIPQPIRLR